MSADHVRLGIKHYFGAAVWKQPLLFGKIDMILRVGFLRDGASDESSLRQHISLQRSGE